MTQLSIKLAGLSESDRELQQFVRELSDLRPFWRQLGERLADDAQSRWPLRRRTGALRRSLMWAGDRLGGGGIYDPSPDRLRFGSAIFYGRFFQHGTTRQRETPLVHVNESDVGQRLTAWVRDRASAAGFEVTG